MFRAINFFIFASFAAAKNNCGRICENIFDCKESQCVSGACTNMMYLEPVSAMSAAKSKAFVVIDPSNALYKPTRVPCNAQLPKKQKMEFGGIHAYPPMVIPKTGQQIGVSFVCGASAVTSNPLCPIYNQRYVLQNKKTPIVRLNPADFRAMDKFMPPVGSDDDSDDSTYFTSGGFFDNYFPPQPFFFPGAQPDFFGRWFENNGNLVERYRTIRPTPSGNIEQIEQEVVVKPNGFVRKTIKSKKFTFRRPQVPAPVPFYNPFPAPMPAPVKPKSILKKPTVKPMPAPFRPAAPAASPDAFPEDRSGAQVTNSRTITQGAYLVDVKLKSRFVGASLDSFNPYVAQSNKTTTGFEVTLVGQENGFEREKAVSVNGAGIASCLPKKQGFLNTWELECKKEDGTVVVRV